MSSGIFCQNKTTSRWLEVIWVSPRTPGKSCLGKQWVWNLRCERSPSSLSFFANSSTTVYFLTVQQISPISPNTGSAQKAGNKEDCWSIFCKQRTNIQTKTVTRNNLGICSPRSKVDTWERVMNDEWCAQTPKVLLPVYKYWIVNYTILCAKLTFHQYFNECELYTCFYCLLLKCNVTNSLISLDLVITGPIYRKSPYHPLLLSIVSIVCC